MSNEANTRTRSRTATALTPPDYIQLNEDGSLEIELMWPITIGGVSRESLHMRRFTVGDRMKVMRKHGKKGVDLDKDIIASADMELALFGNITGLAPEEVELLDPKDYERLSLGFKDFLGLKPANSTT